jgi:mono/diheme cytochrome c family protein
MIFYFMRQRLGTSRVEGRSVALLLVSILAVLAFYLPNTHAADPAPGLGPQTPKEIAGRKLFVRMCSECHADDGSGDEGPDLRGLDSSDQKIRRMITQGRKGEMPAFKKLDDEAINSLISYLRTLKEPSS